MPFYTKTLRQKNRFFLLSEPSPDTAQAENDAMAELSGEQQAELVRLTDLFSEQMRLKFQSINKNTL